MNWRKTRADETVTEWERADGFATLRLRERTDGRFVVRVDRLTQASEGRGYERATTSDRESALAVIERWQEEYDVPEDEV